MDNYTVYLVDDDAGVLKALSRLLRAKGYEVKPYLRPQEFLEQHDATVLGCAVLDLVMPGLDGLTPAGTERRRLSAADHFHYRKG